MHMIDKRLKFFGWGYEGDQVAKDELQWFEDTWMRVLGTEKLSARPAPELAEIELRPPRVSPVASLAAICSTEKYDRAAHAYGKSVIDLARMLDRDFSNPPDVVAYPHTEKEIVALLDWAGGNSIAVTPYGGGSSVVGGVEPTGDGRYRGTLTIDLRNLGKVLEIDPVSETARIQAGVYGPALERQLKPSGLAMRFFLQAFEFSSLGGWIATRAAGHYATVNTQIDDHIESVRAATPGGIFESRRLPASGAGPDPNRLFLGSEGTLGIVTEAWIKLRKQPRFRASTTVRIADFYKGAEMVRAISQAGLYPSNCRLIEAEEAAFTEAGDGSDAIVILGFESADHPVHAWMRRALEICADYGGRWDDAQAKKDAAYDAAAANWRGKFIRGPYLREHAVARSVMRDTFESAITWDRFADFHANVKRDALTAIREVTGRSGSVTCRLTHVYPDGPAPYFTYHALGDCAQLVRQFRDLKAACAAALVKHGGTVTHHHAVGRDHMAGYEIERPPLFTAALSAAKRVFDPSGILNPGILMPPQPAAAESVDIC
jgi:alkyldihydroxyacetonephosphate synthase